jgi:hypothetical protein
MPGYLTHPDYATLVDPLYFVKRARKNYSYTLFAEQRGWSSEAMTG